MRLAAVLLALVAGCTFDLPLFCGDGRVGDAEECDDANDLDGDGCDSNCTVTRCGNGLVVLGEQCDDADLDNGDGCDNNCTVTACGNGIATIGEECDAGVMNADDGECLHDCRLARCGDGYILKEAEECDAGAGNSNTGGCLVNCLQAKCGDGFVWSGVEQCDDGNSNSCGTCNQTCTVSKSGGDCPVGVGCRRNADCFSGVCGPQQVCL